MKHNFNAVGTFVLTAVLTLLASGLAFAESDDPPTAADPPVVKQESPAPVPSPVTFGDVTRAAGDTMHRNYLEEGLKRSAKWNQDGIRATQMAVGVFDKYMGGGGNHPFSDGIISTGGESVPMSSDDLQLLFDTTAVDFQHQRLVFLNQTIEEVESLGNKGEAAIQILREVNQDATFAIKLWVSCRDLQLGGEECPTHL